MKVVNRIIDWCLALAVAAPAAAIFVQVVLRYVFNQPASWLDEFAVLAFGWMTLIGAAVVQRDDAHMSVEYFVKILPARPQLLLYLMRLAIVACVLIVLLWQGFLLTQQMSFIEYPAMEISRGFLFAILPVWVPFILIYLGRSAVPRLRRGFCGRRILERPHAGDGL